jgi:CheY-like chemotaxis protein
MVRIQVWDTGIGVPEAEQRRIFDEFLRLDQGARAARGLGLGLSIVERLGRVLAHPISLHSRPGLGSVFAVEAPIGLSGPTQAIGASGGEPQSRIEPLAGLKVLAIDNEPRVLDGMRVLLQKWGCRVATADGLAAALSSLDVEPDVIIADYHLDDENGLAVIAALRERLGWIAPAILTTADRTPEVRDAAAAAEVALLNKPLKPAPLRAQLSRFLALRAAAE